MGDMVANHWVDADHKRGLWRVSPLAAYLAGKPQWRTLIDVDALGKAEGKSWVWHGADCLPPEYPALPRVAEPRRQRCRRRPRIRPATGQVRRGRVHRSAKARTTRPGSTATHLLVATVEGEGTVTTSGYPRIVKEWKRGTPWSAATKVAEGMNDDIGVSPFAVMDGDTRCVAISRNVGFYTIARVDAARPTAAGSNCRSRRRRPSSVVAGQAIVTLVEPLGVVQPGSVVAFDVAAMLAGQKPAADAGDGADARARRSRRSRLDRSCAVDQGARRRLGQIVRVWLARRTAAGLGQAMPLAGQQHHPSCRHGGQAGHRLRHRRGHADTDRP